MTKKRERALGQVLCYDELLYEKFRHLNEDLQRREIRFRARRQIEEVIQKRGNMHYALQVLDVREGANGLVVICR